MTHNLKIAWSFIWTAALGVFCSLIAAPFAGQVMVTQGHVLGYVSYGLLIFVFWFFFPIRYALGTRKELSRTLPYEK